jgi:hypothetical protein
VTGVQTGLKLTYYFENSNECVSFVTSMLNDVYYFQKVYTQGYFEDMSYNISYIVGGNFANSVFNCYLFMNSVESVVQYRYS